MKIISLTSTPGRFRFLGPTLESLLTQGADEVRLYIPSSYRRFQDWDFELPKVPRGITVVRVENDLGPATKILPACEEFRGKDVQILFCDDDCIAADGWGTRLFDSQSKKKAQAVAAYVRPVEGYIDKVAPVGVRRAKQLPIEYDIFYRSSRLLNKLFGTPELHRRPFVVSGYGEIFFGVGGVVVRPDFFDRRTYRIPEIAWLVDDIWLSANLARRDIKIFCPALVPLPKATAASDIDALLDETFESKRRFELNCAAANYCKSTFGIWN